MFQRALCVLLSVAVACTSVACTTSGPPVAAKPGEVVKKARVGDEVRITTDSGREYFLTVVEVDPAYIRGDDPDTGKRYRIPTDRIKVIQYEEFSVGKTAAATGAGLLVVYGVVMVLVVAALTGFGESLACAFTFGADCED